MITVVTGLPRAGTSLAMQLIRAAGYPLLTDDFRGADDSNPRGYFEFAPAKAIARDSSWLADGFGRAVKVVIPLVEQLPICDLDRVLLMERDLDEIIASQSAMLLRSGRPAVSPAVLRPVLEAQLRRARAFLEKSGASVLELNHRSLITHPRAQAARVAGFLGLGDPEIMAIEVDPQLYRQRSAPAVPLKDSIERTI